MGTMDGGVTTNEYVYHYKQLEKNVYYDIKLAFGADFLSFDIDGSDIRMTGFNTSLPVLWDKNIYIGQDNQYLGSRDLVINKFRLDKLNIYTT